MARVVTNACSEVCCILALVKLAFKHLHATFMHKTFSLLFSCVLLLSSRNEEVTSFLVLYCLGSQQLLPDRVLHCSIPQGLYFSYNMTTRQNAEVRRDQRNGKIPYMTVLAGTGLWMYYCKLLHSRKWSYGTSKTVN